ncbi:XRE family transcriptional regulator [Brevibacillus sp. VP]|uniref:helix-turn-helix transcriptional regulator n=1 Tax=Brevibacillus sp. VP TaxID=2293326 RepID=UPI000E2E7E48|nr:helix-turn-helix transcriptional regulator [Brevibacillus sp. VP]RFB31382.1 XRE family transcriptional regulator [Brevibacillus sp. VP]
MNSRNWLIDLRKSKGLTHEQVARLAGINRSTYTKAENGFAVSVKTAKRIASVFGIDWTIFFENNCDETEQKLA